jgi:hypothetical protein
MRLHERHCLSICCSMKTIFFDLALIWCPCGVLHVQFVVELAKIPLARIMHLGGKVVCTQANLYAIPSTQTPIWCWIELRSCRSCKHDWLPGKILNCSPATWGRIQGLGCDFLGRHFNFLQYCSATARIYVLLQCAVRDVQVHAGIFPCFCCCPHFNGLEAKHKSISFGSPNWLLLPFSSN